MSGTDYTLHHAGYGRDCVPEIVAAKGAYLQTRDGRDIFDAGLGAGSQILGHAHAAVVTAVQRQIQDGSIYLCNNPQIHQLCEQLSVALPDTQKHYVFCNSGSEATQRAVRLARAATGRERVACFQGGWHGMNEWTLLDDGARFGAGPKAAPHGIPAMVSALGMALPYNDEQAFELIERHGAELAAVIIEPVQGSNPRDDVLPFLQRLQAVCKTHGILLIFDEIITGFRLGMGGAGSFWGLEPDIVTYGKVLGGGLPIGLMTCTDRVADLSFNDTDKRILTGGTFSANPLVAATASAVIEQLGQCAYEEIDRLGSRFREQVVSGFAAHGVPFSAVGIGSISRVAFTDKPFRNRAERDALEVPAAVQQRFRERLLAADVLWPTNGIVFTGFCHDEQQIDALCEKVVAAAVACAAEVDLP